MGIITIDSTQFIINMVVCFIAGVGILFFLLKSFLPAWFNVRRAGGNKILVHIANPLMDYYSVGSIDNGFLYYKARRRKDNPDPNRMLFVGDIRDFSYKAFGVNVVDVDDLKNCVWSRYGTASLNEQGKSSNYVAVSTNNAEAYDEAQYTALHKPATKKTMFDEYTWQIIVIIAIVLLGVGAFLIYRQTQTIDAHIKLVYDYVTPMRDLMLNITTNATG
jgi:hypothetical protein